MKITRRQLRRIIRESLIKEMWADDDGPDWMRVQEQEEMMHKAIIQSLDVNNSRTAQASMSPAELVDAASQVIERELGGMADAEDISNFLDDLQADGVLNFDAESQEWSLA
tara:strand:+ start:384 stop:716 length:333 start_codon:yes stop_codon:yes gene_type:complete